MMNSNSLSLSFGNSLRKSVPGIAQEYIEIGLDAIMDEGILKEIPIVSTTVALFNMGNSIREKHHIKKLISFLNEINNGIVDEEKLVNYREKFLSNERSRNQELEYILVLIDRYIDYNKPQMLAKLYLAYLDEKINWDEFAMYAEITDRFLATDYKTLLSDTTIFRIRSNFGAESILRLAALGLMVEDNSISLSEAKNQLNDEYRSALRISNDSRVKKYKRTDFGRKLVTILR